MHIVHDAHPEIFSMPEAEWVRKMPGEVPTDVFHDKDYGPSQLVELCVALVAEQGSSVALMAIALEVDDEDLEDELEMVPIAVYYYAITDEGYTTRDAIFISHLDVDEDLVPPPPWIMYAEEDLD